MAKARRSTESQEDGALFDRPGPILLKKEFPMTYRRAFKKAFWRFVLLVVVARAATSAESIWVQQIADEHLKFNLRLIFISLTVAAFIWWLARVIYYEIERRYYDYRVVGGNLYLSKGMFVKETGSFPLSRITDIYLHRGMGDYFWGLSSLHVSTPTATSGEFAFIHGLTTRNAVRLRRQLEQLIKEHDHHIENISGLMGNVAAIQGQKKSERAALKRKRKSIEDAN